MEDTYADLKSILLEKSVRTGEFTLASGKTSDLYIDCRVTALDPIGAGLIGKLGWEAVRNRIKEEGFFAEGNQVVVVDDVITTGGSTIQAIEAIERAGGTVKFALILVDREEGGRAAIEAKGIPVVSLYSRTTLL